MKINMLRWPLSCRGKEWGWVSLHLQKLQGLLPRQNLSTLQASRRFTPSSPLSSPAWVWANATRLHSVVWGRAGLGGAPPPLFFQAEWRAAGWTHAWQMAFQRVFRSHLGWVQLLQTMLLTKPEGLLPGRKEVKQILSCFSGTACYIKKKKKNHQADKLGFSTAYNTAFGLSSCKSGQKYLVAISFKWINMVPTYYFQKGNKKRLWNTRKRIITSIYWMLTYISECEALNRDYWISSSQEI